MKRLVMAIVGAGLVWGCVAVEARAQAIIVRPRQTRPTVSPYLNLGRGGNPALNYYNFTRPQFETNRALQELQSDIEATQALAEQQYGQPARRRTVPEENITGHPVRFFSLSPYFTYNPTRTQSSGSR